MRRIDEVVLRVWQFGGLSTGSSICMMILRVPWTLCAIILCLVMYLRLGSPPGTHPAFTYHSCIYLVYLYTNILHYPNKIHNILQSPTLPHIHLRPNYRPSKQASKQASKKEPPPSPNDPPLSSNNFLPTLPYFVPEIERDT